MFVCVYVCVQMCWDGVYVGVGPSMKRTVVFTFSGIKGNSLSWNPYISFPLE